MSEDSFDSYAPLSPTIRKGPLVKYEVKSIVEDKETGKTVVRIKKRLVGQKSPTKNQYLDSVLVSPKNERSFNSNIKILSVKKVIEKADNSSELKQNLSQNQEMSLKSPQKNFHVNGARLSSGQITELLESDIPAKEENSKSTRISTSARKSFNRIGHLATNKSNKRYVSESSGDDNDRNAYDVNHVMANNSNFPPDIRKVSPLTPSRSKRVIKKTRYYHEDEYDCNISSPKTKKLSSKINLSKHSTFSVEEDNEIDEYKSKKTPIRKESLPRSAKKLDISKRLLDSPHTPTRTSSRFKNKVNYCLEKLDTSEDNEKSQLSSPLRSKTRYSNQRKTQEINSQSSTHISTSPILIEDSDNSDRDNVPDNILKTPRTPRNIRVNKVPNNTPRTPVRSSRRSVRKCNYNEQLSDEESETSLSVRLNKLSVSQICSRRKLIEDTNNDSDYSLDSESIMKTPKRSTRKLIQTPNSSRRSKGHQLLSTPCRIPPNSPRTPVSRLKCKLAGTPTMPSREKEISTPSSALQIAMSRLHVSTVPEKLPCRDAEFMNIYFYTKGKLMDELGGSMYISGVPGTGKTATVRSVVKELKLEVEKHQIPDFKYIEVNGLKLSEPRQAYVTILKHLTGEKLTSEQAYSKLDKIFSRKSNKTGTVLLVDEVDMLCTKRQDVVYNILDWPTKAESQLVVIAIANTMDLPERLLKGRCTSRLGLTRVTFQPYNFKQLEEIVKHRLYGIEAFEADAVQYIARKVAAVSGDARRALNICRRSTEIAEQDEETSNKHATLVDTPKKKKLPNKKNLVTMKHVNQAVDEMFSTPMVNIIRGLSWMEQTFLRAVSSVVQRTGQDKTQFKRVFETYKSLCTIEGKTPLTCPKTLAMCARLGSSRLLITEHSRADIYQQLILNISDEDLHYALQSKDDS